MLFRGHFDEMMFQLEHCLSLWLDDFVCFFLENKTSCPGLLGSELKSNFQLKAHLEINFRSSLRIFALSFSSVTIENRDVSSANSFSFDFNSPGNSLM